MMPNIHIILKAVAIVVVAGIAMWFWGLESLILWSLFFFFLLFRLDNRYLGAVAILFLTSCPIFLALELDAWAAQMAVYAYYFLVMTVALKIVEFKRDVMKIRRTPEKATLDLRTEAKKKVRV